MGIPHKRRFLWYAFGKKEKTKSGAIAVQGVQYVGHRSIVARYIGSGKDEVEVTILRQKAFTGLKSNLPN